MIPIPDEGLYRVAGTTVLQLAIFFSAQPVCDWLDFTLGPVTLPHAGNKRIVGARLDVYHLSERNQFRIHYLAIQRFEFDIPGAGV